MKTTDSEALSAAFLCQQCGQTLAFVEESAGHKFRCPTCLCLDFVPARADRRVPSGSSRPERGIRPILASPRPRSGAEGQFFRWIASIPALAPEPSEPAAPEQELLNFQEVEPEPFKVLANGALPPGKEKNGRHNPAPSVHPKPESGDPGRPGGHARGSQAAVLQSTGAEINQSSSGHHHTNGHTNGSAKPKTHGRNKPKTNGLTKPKTHGKDPRQTSGAKKQNTNGVAKPKTGRSPKRKTGRTAHQPPNGTAHSKKNGRSRSAREDAPRASIGPGLFSPSESNDHGDLLKSLADHGFRVESRPRQSTDAASPSTSTPKVRLEPR